MANRVTNIEMTDARRRTRYPWVEWADGDTWLLIRGDDYIVSDEAMKCAAYMHARRSGMKVRTETGKKGVYVQFEPAPKKTVKKPSPVKKPKKLPRNKNNG